jgi:protocatechuate 3,4-dioxygenase, beta subunit
MKLASLKRRRAVLAALAAATLPGGVRSQSAPSVPSVPSAPGALGASVGTQPLTQPRALTQPSIQALTPSDVEGPFYPLAFPTDTDNDLTQMSGGRASGSALGERLHVGGRVQTQDGSAIAGARVEIWQVDHGGSYIHPDGANRSAQRDAGFQGFGATLTDSDGRYQFTTIKPPPYAGRPAHIHFKVKRKGKPDFTTQLYFSAVNPERGSASRRGAFDRERLTVSVTPGANNTPAQAVFHIVL